MTAEWGCVFTSPLPVRAEPSELSDIYRMSALLLQPFVCSLLCISANKPFDRWEYFNYYV